MRQVFRSLARSCSADPDASREVTDQAGVATISVSTGFDAITVLDDSAPAETQLTFNLSNSTNIIERTVRLRRGVPIAGLVLDPRGEPIAGAVIQVWGEGDVQLFRESDTNGVWRVRAMCAGAFEARAGAEGYARGPTVSGMHDGLTPIEGLTLSISIGARLFGRVIDANGEPCVATNVFTQVMPGDDHLTSTDAYGPYEFRGLESGRRSVDAVGLNAVIVIPDGATDYEFDVTAPLAGEPQAPVSSRRLARAELAAPVTIVGRAVRNGTLVEDFIVDLRGEGLISSETFHTRDGRFTLIQPRAWTCTVNAFALGSTWTSTPAFELKPAVTNELGDLDLLQGARLTGVVRDLKGCAVADATISSGINGAPDDELEAAARGYYQTQSRDDGTFVFESVYVAERSVIMASHPSSGTSRSIPIQGNAELALVLLPTGAIDGVLEQPGVYVGLLLIHGQTPGSGSQHCKVRPSGAFAIERLVPGDYTLEVIRRPRWPRRAVRVTVACGQRAFVRIPGE